MYNYSRTTIPKLYSLTHDPVNMRTRELSVNTWENKVTNCSITCLKK